MECNGTGGSILDRAPSRNGKGVRERRQSHRYTAVNDRLWIGWWAGDEFVLIQGSLVNVSDGGVLVGVNPAPTPGHRVWMRLEGTAQEESLSARVLESSWVTLKRRYSVRLAFEQQCPTDFYETALSEPRAPGSLT